jgi:tetratricopeptide (TPR) repeat protein
MLETIRQYADEQLSRSAQATAARDRHLICFLHLAEEAAQRFRKADQAVWLARLAVEHDNLRSALAWTLASHQPDRGARLGIALWRFWYIRGYYDEGWQWLVQLLAQVEQPQLRAQLFYGQGMLARRRADSATAAACFAESSALFRTLGDQRGLASALRGLGFIHYFCGDEAQARPLFEEALALFRVLDDKEGIAVTLDNLGYITHDREQERRFYQESLALRRRSGNLHGITNSLAGLAYYAIHEGDYATARGYVQEHLQINEALGNQNGVASGLVILGQIAFMEGDYGAAQLLYEKSRQLCEETNDWSQLGNPIVGLGTIALQQGEYAQASRLFEQSLGVYQTAGALVALARVLGHLGTLAVKQGQAVRALSLAGAATAVCGTLHVYGLALEQRAFEQTQATARRLLTAEEAAAAWAVGQAMTPEQAVAYALTKTET